MLSAVKDLQHNTVSALVKAVHEPRKEFVFKAPTGSGKTFMMADFMDRVLRNQPDVVFLVSCPSKAGLAKQNFDKFEEYQADGKFSTLDCCLISSDTGGEAGVFVPANHNVYVLPYSLTQKEGRIMKGAFERFLLETAITCGKDIWLIVDEGHIAKNGLDAYNDLFKKIVYFSATPERLFKKRKHLAVDVELDESDAMDAHLIKRVEYVDNTDLTLAEGLRAAIDKLVDIQSRSNTYDLGLNPCLIIQVSNKTKGVEEIREIQRCIEQYNTGGDRLQYAVMLDTSKKHGSMTNNKELMRLPVARWKEEIKKATSPIDVLVFKMVVTEGYDIPRAQLLYQVRDTASDTLDRQVIGRVRRNPKLADFERLPPQAQNLLSTAYVWGVADKDSGIVPVNLAHPRVQEEMAMYTTRLDALEEQIVNVDVSRAQQGGVGDGLSVFDLYRRFERLSDPVRDAVSAHTHSYHDWLAIMANVSQVERQVTLVTRNWQDFMVRGEKTSVPVASYFLETSSTYLVNNSIWVRADGKQDFSFDSDAERIFMAQLVQFSFQGLIKKVDGTTSLFGKNYLPDSRLGFQYYLNGVRTSYPDFLLKDQAGRMHVFEVKSVNQSTRFNIDHDEYMRKVEALKDCYMRASQLTDYWFHIPVFGKTWQIYTYHQGVASVVDMAGLEQTLR